MPHFNEIQSSDEIQPKFLTEATFTALTPRQTMTGEGKTLVSELTKPATPPKTPSLIFKGLLQRDKSTNKKREEGTREKRK